MVYNGRSTVPFPLQNQLSCKYSESEHRVMIRVIFLLHQPICLLFIIMSLRLFFRLFIIIQIYPIFSLAFKVFPSVVAIGHTNYAYLVQICFWEKGNTVYKCDDEPGHRLNSVPNATTPGNTLGKLHHKTP